MEEQEKNKVTDEKPTEDAEVNRAPRFESHALVEIKTGLLPFSTASAVLLDLSVGGFKIEFVNPVKIKTNIPMTMTIPLAPFQIMSPSKIKLRVIVKWFDSRQLRAGGIFENISDDVRYLFERILTVISEQSSRRGLNTGHRGE